METGAEWFSPTQPNHVYHAAPFRPTLRQHHSNTMSTLRSHLLPELGHMQHPLSAQPEAGTHLVYTIPRTFPHSVHTCFLSSGTCSTR